MNPINKRWFQQKLADRGASQAALAAYLGLDASAISTTFSGKRKMQLDEAEKIALFLATSIEDVLINAGLKLQGTTRPVPLVGSVDGDAVVHFRKGAAEETVQGPTCLPDDTVALRYQTVGTPREILDGMTVFFSPRNTLDPSLITRMCIANIVGGGARIGYLRRGYEVGTYNLASSYSMLKNLRLESAMPVSFLKP